MTPNNKTRPRYARVKVEVDLLIDFSKRVNVGIKKKSGEIVAKWILPKYCKIYKLQGYNKKCFVLHPKLYPKKKDNEKKKVNNKSSSQKEEQKEKKRTNQSDKGKKKENYFQETRQKMVQGEDIFIQRRDGSKMESKIYCYER